MIELLFKILKVVLFEVVKAIIDLLFERLTKTQRKGVAEALTWQNIRQNVRCEGRATKDNLKASDLTQYG